MGVTAHRVIEMLLDLEGDPEAETKVIRLLAEVLQDLEAMVHAIMGRLAMVEASLRNMKGGKHG